MNRSDELLVRLSTAPQQLAIERRSFPRAFEARLAALLKEVDEIVLPRMLRVYAGSQEIARLIISHRRLIDIEMPGRTPTPNDAEDRPSRFAARLLEIAAARADLSMTVSRRPPHPNRAENACSVQSLKQALELATTQNAFDRLLRQATAQSLAQLIWSDKVAQAQFSGSRDWSALLQGFSEKYRTTHGGQKADVRFAPLQTEGLAIALATGQLLMIASLGKNGIAAIFPKKAGLELIAKWQLY